MIYEHPGPLFLLTARFFLIRGLKKVRRFLLPTIITIGAAIPSVTFAVGACDTGYDASALAIFEPTDIAPNRNDGTCDTGYEQYLIYDNLLYPAPHDTPVRCGDNEYYKNGACVQYVTGTCDTGYKSTGVYSMFEPPNIAPDRATGACDTGYDAFTLYNLFKLEFASSNPERCGAGYYHSNNTCVALARDGCPTNYYVPIPTNAFERIFGDETCATNYELYDDTVDLCKQFLGPDMAETCTPQKRCSAGANVLKSDETGMEIPIYDEQATQTTLNFIFDNGGHCYMNMLPGAENNVPTINVVDDNNNTFHGVK